MPFPVPDTVEVPVEPSPQTVPPLPTVAVVYS